MTQVVLHFSMAKQKTPATIRKPPGRQAKNGGISKPPAAYKKPSQPKPKAKNATQTVSYQAADPPIEAPEASWEAALATLTAITSEQSNQISTLASSVEDLRNKMALSINHPVTEDGNISVAGSDITLTDHDARISGEVPVPISMTHSDSHLNVPKFSPGLAAGETVKHVLKVKLWSHKFIEFFDLLYPNSTPSYSMTFQGDSGNPHLMLAPKKRKILDEIEWGMACDVFTAVYVERYPEQLSALLTYSRHVKDLMKHKADWRFYDEEYRRAREFNPYSFFTIRQDLELRAFRKANLVTKPDQTKSSSDNHVPNGFCFKFHKRETYCNLGDNCNYSHECSRCNSNHPMYRPCNQSENSSRPGPSSSRPSPNHNKRQGPRPSP